MASKANISVQARITLMLAVIIAAFVGLYGLLMRYEKERDVTFFQREAEERRLYFGKLLKINETVLENLAGDYSYWDQMIEFLSTVNKKWASENIDTSLPIYKATALWIYQKDLTLAYSANTLQAPELGKLPLPMDSVSRMFAKKGYFVHFFTMSPKGLIEINGAPIQPPSDKERTSAPRGFLFVGRLWTPEYLKELSGLSDSSVSLVPVGWKPAPAKIREIPTVIFSKELPGWDGKPITSVVISKEPVFASSLRRAAKKQFALLVVFAFFLLFLLFISLRRWVSGPLKLISESLSTGDLGPVKGILGVKTELGQVARLIVNFFEQREQLVTEVAERKRGAEELRHRLKVEEAVAHVSTMLASEESADFDRLLRVLGEAVGADSAFVFRSSGGVEPLVMGGWNYPGPSEAFDGGDSPELAVFRWAEARFLENGKVLVPDVSAMPDEEAEARAAFRARGVRSFLGVPFFSAGRLTGYLGFNASDGANQWSEEDARLLFSASEIIGAFLERKRTEQELLKVMKLESLGVVAGGIAHDFNNLLTAILGNVSLALSMGGMDDGVVRCLTQTEKAARRASSLTRQLLTFSKGGAPVKKTASITELVTESAGFVMKGSNVICEFDLPGDLPPVDVDPGQISQVIENLVINAKQSMPDGGRITISAVSVPPDGAGNGGGYVRLTFRDHGVGIPEAYLTRIFDPYFTTKEHGNGLGLATSYSIIKGHGGEITVESTVGVGTAFHITLPASTKPVAEKGTTARSVYTGGGRVLLLDDEEEVRAAVGRMLGVIGYDVATAKDSAEALDLYRSALKSGARFDVVVMDLTIPGGIGGKEAVRLLLDIDPDVRAIVSSGYSNDPVISDYRSHGFRGAIVKPYGIQDLREALTSVMTGG